MEPKPDAEPPKVDEHPEDVEPLGRPHPVYSKSEKRTILLLSIMLIAGIVAVPILSVMSLSPMSNVLLALSPLLLTMLLDILLVSSHYKAALLWVCLFLVHILGLGLLHAVNPMLATPLNVQQAVMISFLISLIVTIIAAFSEMKVREPRAGPYPLPLPMEFTPEKLPEFVQSIEDKAKAINFAIGRVYRSSNGGTAAMRARLRIERDWYNEFNTPEADKELQAKVLVRKIHDRLNQYVHKEKELFSEKELKKLKNLKRSEQGESTVLEVLHANDSDPVEGYYAAALEFCEKILQGLER